MAAATKKPTVKRRAKPAAAPAATTTKKTAKSASPKNDAFKSVEDFTAAAREQFESLTGALSGSTTELRETAQELSGAARDGFDNTQAHVAEVTAELVESTRNEVSDAVQFTKDLTSAKSLTDALEIQHNYWTNLFETRIERSRDITERSVEVTRANLAPFTAKAPAIFGGLKA